MHTENIRTKKPPRIFALILCAVMLSACSSVTGSSSPEDTALVSLFRDRLTETVAPPDGENVYWVRSGTVYHLTPDCRFLADAEDVICSSAAESGKSKPCTSCAGGGDGSDTDPPSAETNSAETAPAEPQITETQTAETNPNTPQTTVTQAVTTESAPAESAAPQTVPPIQTAPAEQTEAEQTEAPAQSAAVTAQPEPEPDPTPITGVVWWVESGEVWHTTRSCPSLARSKNVYSGTVAESGKDRVCKRCG